MATVMPAAEGALLIGVDEPDRAMANTFRLNRQLGGEGSFPRATFLLRDYDGFQYLLLY